MEVRLQKKVLIINGVERPFMCDPERETLSDALRRIGLTGVKVGCGTRCVRFMFCYSERKGYPFLYEEDRGSRGLQQDHHHRGHW